MTEISEDIETLLAGLEVESVSELKRLVDLGRETDIWFYGPRPVSSETSRGTAERQP